MKRAFLIHGWDGHPEEGWRPWLKEKLREKGFEVNVPFMPDTATPTLSVWLPYLAKTVTNPTPEDYFVGHSLGCITILRFLESLKENQQVGGAVFVAGFAKDLTYPGYKGELSSFFQKTPNFSKIKEICPKFIAIHSDNDPYVPIKNGYLFEKELGAKLIIEHGMRHFSGDDGINRLPSALSALLEIAKVS